MKPVFRILLIGAALALTATEINAQEKKKKEQDVSYLEQKHRVDEQRRSDVALKHRNDSIRRAEYRDSINTMLRNDSIRYSKMGTPRPDSINPPADQRRDSLYRDDMPPRSDKKMEKGCPPKGPNPGVRHIDMGMLCREADVIVV